MRRHEVNCVIEGNIEDAKENVQISMNEFLVKILEKELMQSEMTKEERIDFIDKLIEKSKKI